MLLTYDVRPCSLRNAPNCNTKGAKLLGIPNHVFVALSSGQTATRMGQHLGSNLSASQTLQTPINVVLVLSPDQSATRKGPNFPESIQTSKPSLRFLPLGQIAAVLTLAKAGLPRRRGITKTNLMTDFDTGCKKSEQRLGTEPSPAKSRVQIPIARDRAVSR